jgi:hypothetical protein
VGPPTDAVTFSTKHHIRFGNAAPILSGYPVEDIQLIWNLMQRCQYRKPLEKMVSDNSPFQVSADDKQVIIQGDSYYPPAEGEKIMGVCHELSYFVMQELEQKLGKQYEFALVNGNSPQYFHHESSNHVYIIARQRAHKKRFARSLAREIINITKSGLTDLPKNCLLIDPSFAKLAATDNPHGYRLTSLLRKSLVKKHFHAETQQKVCNFNELGETKIWPLGYLSDLLDLSKVKILDIPPQSLVHWGFSKSQSSSKSDIDFYIHPNPTAKAQHYTRMSELLKSQAPDNPLRRFTNKVRSQLGHQDSI